MTEPLISWDLDYKMTETLTRYVEIEFQIII